MRERSAWTLSIDSGTLEGFARATGDRASLHLDPGFARLTRFRRTIVHGMLPIWSFLDETMSVGKGGSLRLAQLACRFLEPCHLGDSLWATTESSGPGASLNFVIHRASDGASITSGSASFAPSGPAEAPSAESMATQSITENILAMEALGTGRLEILSFRALPSALAFLRRTGLPSRPPDPNLAAATWASTMIGMRLPGRYAAFTELSVEFTKPLTPGAEIVLEATLEKVRSESQRVQLNLTWSEEGKAVGRGSASALVGAAPASAASCADLKTESDRIDGRVALVTGASRGIGAVTAKLLAMRGAKVAVHYHRGEADAEAVVADILAHGGKAIAVGADLKDEASIRRALSAVVEALGAVDILVNNAVGSFNPKAFTALTRDDTLDELGVTLIGPQLCCQLVVPHMRAQKWGRIVNIGTVATEIPVPSQTKYIVSKSALLGLTRSLATEFLHDNIQVNMVVPAMTETSLLAPLPHSLVGRIASDSPSGRLLQPLEVARVIGFLVSQGGGSISGQQIVISRGEPPYL